MWQYRKSERESAERELKPTEEKEYEWEMLNICGEQIHAHALLDELLYWKLCVQEGV